MKKREILKLIESLPVNEQYAIAISVLDQLAISGKIEITDRMRQEIHRRDVEFEMNPSTGESWDLVQREIFD